MARYTYARVQIIETNNFYAEITENFFRYNRYVKVKIYSKKRWAFRNIFSHKEKIPFELFPGIKAKEKQWANANIIIYNIAQEKLNLFEHQLKSSEKR